MARLVASPGWGVDIAGVAWPVGGDVSTGAGLVGAGVTGNCGDQVWGGAG